MKFDINMQFDKRALEREMNREVNSAMRDTARKLNRRFSEIARTAEGRDLDSVKSEVARAFRSEGADVSEPELTEYAQHLLEGTVISFEPGTLRV
ncbi:hypothetical protein [Microcella sp.]|uniref:hypothetical protein n=1 Tax=Microcella sp. TaxID=1913979 RepID=UPI00299F5A69|nr:hypothetical protein [Microcella sp.]MDX2025039.1 hypothetical protein [Microcella sp.]